MTAPAGLVERIRRRVWQDRLCDLSPARRRLVGMVRGAWLVARELAAGDLTNRAASLVYTTLLSLVPLLAVSFAVLKGFGVHNQLEPALLGLLEPLGEEGPELTHAIIGFVDNLQLGVLGSVGLAVLVYTAVSLIQKVEAAFNHVWRVDRPRPLARRFTDYLSVILIGPTLVFSALGATASLTSSAPAQALAAVEPLGPALSIAARLTPYALVVAAFTFAYWFLPNTRVRVRSALVGALVAGALWQTAGWGFTTFVVDTAPYAAVYSGFAIVLLFMIWLDLAWLILLAGSAVAFYHQHPECLRVDAGRAALSPRQREAVAIDLMRSVGAAHMAGEAAPTAQDLVARVALPLSVLAGVLDALATGRLVVTTGDDPPRYLPARALERLPLREVVAAVRAADEAPLPRVTGPGDPVGRVAAAIDAAVGDALGALTVRDLLEGR